MEFISKIGAALQSGGAFVYPIHVIFVLSIAITLERLYVLYIKSSMNTKSFLNQLAPSIERNDLQSSVQFCDSITAPQARVAKTLLVRALNRGNRDDIEAMIEASLSRESHPVERRTSYLSMLANIATLLGLLGTISGLIVSFGATASVDPSMKAELLAKGISEAMNCTAYGLVVAIFSLLAFALLQGKTQAILDELKETAYDIRAMLHFEPKKKVS